MNLSHYCIDRPIFASVLSIVITLGGAVAMLNLPIAQYPDVTPPQITISATYPGASADVVANNVAAFEAFITKNDASQHAPNDSMFSAYPATVQDIIANT